MAEVAVAEAEFVGVAPVAAVVMAATAEEELRPVLWERLYTVPAAPDAGAAMEVADDVDEFALLDVGRARTSKRRRRVFNFPLAPGAGYGPGAKGADGPSVSSTTLTCR